MKIIDLRSDTVTQPTKAMRQAMAMAPVGDDVYGEDPTVNRLETMAAELLGKEEALFVTSGTQANLISLLCHCKRGDEYIAGQQAHCYRFEGGGDAAVGGIHPQPIDFETDGTLDLATVAAAIKPDDPHFPSTRLLCLENTQAGKVTADGVPGKGGHPCRGAGDSPPPGRRFASSTRRCISGCRLPQLPGALTPFPSACRRGLAPL